MDAHAVSRRGTGDAGACAAGPAAAGQYTMKERLRIVLASRFLVGYPQGGGHWSAFLQHLLGLDALGHDVFWLELYDPPDGRHDEVLARAFGERMEALGFARRWALGLANAETTPDLEMLDVVGADVAHVRRVVREADLLWNFACAVKPPLLGRFKRRALVDGDPGIIQISAEQHDLGLDAHEVLFTAGLCVGDPDCPVPTLGRRWVRFPQFVHLPSWPDPGPPPPGARFTSITQWNWGEVWHEGASYSVSKRDAYMQFVDLPRRCRAEFELAANMDPRDPTGDLAHLRAAGWSLVDPHDVASSPDNYRAYIGRSRAEFCCPKPVYVQMRTGWMSDRSAGFLASARPVLMQDTGLDRHLPVGEGLLIFSDLDMAAAATDAIESNYAAQSAAARRFAEEHLNATKVLSDMLETAR